MMAYQQQQQQQRSLQAGPRPPMPPHRGPDLAVKVECKNCGPDTILIEEFGAGDLVCGGCGLILGDRIVDTRSEWRTFAGDEGDDPSRVGSATNPLDGPETFETSISFRDNNSGLSRELQRAANKSVTTREHNLAEAYQDVSAYCSRISLGQITIDSAKQILQSAHKGGLLRPKTQTAFIGASIFIACRRSHSDRTFKEIETLCRLSKKDLVKAFKALQALLGNSVTSSSSGPPPPPVQPAPSTNADSGEREPSAVESGVISSSARALAASSSDVKVILSLLPRYLSNLGLAQTTGFQSACRHVLEGSKALDLIDGRSPLTVLGSLLLFVGNISICTNPHMPS